MKKINSKGFMLTEVLIVSTLLVTVLLVMYTQFKSIKRSFDDSFTYNNVNDLYGLYNVKKYIEKENYAAMAGRLDINNYVRLDNCSSSYYSSTRYCERLYDTLNIEELYLVNTNLEKIKNNNPFSKKLNAFIKTIESETGYGYRIIAKFKSDKYASLKVFSGTKFKAAIADSCNRADSIEYKIFHKLEDNRDFTEPTVKTGGCGDVIKVVNENTNNKCYKPINYSTEELILANDDNNSATITYEIKTASITINYLDESDDSELKSSRLVTLNCGDKFEIDNYLDTIADYEFVSANKNEVTVGTSNITINLYYEEVS